LQLAELLGPVWKALDLWTGDLAYTNTTQRMLFQLNYFRDLMRVKTGEYRNIPNLPQRNNKCSNVKTTFKMNFIEVKRFAMIKAEDDSPEGEW